MSPMPRLIARVLLASGLLAAGSAQALDFLSVASRAAILYDQPAASAHKVAVVSRYLPLEVVLTQGDWVKVRDASGKLSWIERRALDKKRYLLVIVPLADVRLAADPNAAVLFRVSQQGVLEWLENTQTGWIQVRHPDGLTGYVSTADVWGD